MNRVKAVTFVAAFCLAVFLQTPADRVAAQPLPEVQGALPLHFEQTWLDLNFYHRDGNGFQSQIINADFFLSEEGALNPDKELQAFLRAVQFADDPQGVAELMCRYPARTSFLIDRGRLKDNAFDRSKCNDFNQSVRPDQINAISLVFATGYFGNPSSYYGHVLLQAGTAGISANADGAEGGEDAATLIDRAINYGAEITHDTSNPLYILNGLFGGYDASYNTNSFFIHNHNYLNVQLRDVWIYDLDMTQRQVRFLLEHSWEMRQAKFAYFFVTNNCAHKIAQLLNHTFNTGLMSSAGFWFMPFQLVKNLGDKKLITSETYQASRKTLVEHRLEGLNHDQKAGFTDFLLSDLEGQDRLIQFLSPPAQVVALDYLDMQSAITGMKETGDKAKIDASRQVLLRNFYAHREDERISKILATQTTRQPTSSSLFANPPSSRLDTTYASGDGMERIEVRYRPAHNDLMDIFVGNTLPSDFSMAEVGLEVTASGISLQQIDALKITNLAASNLPFRLNPEFSWSLHLGYAPYTEVCQSCSIGQFQYSAGLAKKLRGGTAYSLAGFRVMNEYQRRGYFGLTWTTGLLMDLSDGTRLGAEFEAEYLARRDEIESRWTVKAAHRLPAGVTVHIGWSHDGDRSIGKAGIAWYFY